MRRLALTFLLIAAAAGWPRPDATSASGAVTVSAGSWHTCAVTTEGGLKCWGINDWGQLGDGTTTRRVAPVAVVGLGSGVVGVDAGHDFTCALTVAGGLKCWGDGQSGQLGGGTWDTDPHPTPVDVVGLGSGVAAVAAGGAHTCALTTSNGVKCWGYNSSGQLGVGTQDLDPHPAPLGVSGLASGVAALAAGGNHNCAVTNAGGGVKCWGSNQYGQVGDGTITNRATPVNVSGLASGVTSVAAGATHACALTTQGGVKCWGGNEFGQLGDGTTTPSLTPVAVSGLASGVVGVAAGDFHTCALTVAGGLKCWGRNSEGQLGDGTITNRAIPVEVTGLASGVSAMAAGILHTAGLTGTGCLKAWGNNEVGQLGDGTTGSSAMPVNVVGLCLQPVGGIAELPDVTSLPAEPSGPSSPSSGRVAALAAAAAIAGAIALSGAVWYAKRRRAG